jgi:MerR family transcriptional regulator, light-induced transcriptional regulator
MDDSSEPRHPIRVVSQRTGLSAPVLRAWERRYGAVTPSRSEGGQRLYSDADLRRLQLLATAVDGGRSIGLIADLDAAELEALIDEDRQAPQHALGDGIAPDVDRIQTALSLVEEMRPSALERFLVKAAVELRPAELVEGLVVPLLNEIGRAWQSGRMGPGSEHMASLAIRRFLEWASAASVSEADAPLAVTGTPSGQRHEFGALLAGVVLTYEGWRERFLGPDLPGEEIVRAARKLGASMVALSAVHPRLDSAAVRGILEVRRALPPDVAVVVGGAAVEPYAAQWEEAGIEHPGTLLAFRDRLRERAGTG